MNPRFAVEMLLAGVTVLGAGVASGQDFPNKPLRIVTGAAGGSLDFVARIIAKGISGPLGQQVIIENREVSFLSAEVTSKAPPNGYTMTVQSSTLWTIPLMREAPYDTVRDFAPISLISRGINILVVHPSVPVKSVKELIDLAKSRPGELNYGSGASGGSAHLALELFKSMAHVNLTRIAYKGGGAALTGLLANEVQVMVTDASLAITHTKAGRARALAVTSAEPSTLAPGLPTVTASGLPGYESEGLTAVFAPARTPVTIINRLNQEIVRVVKRADVKELFFSAGGETVGSSPGQLAAIIKSDIARMSKVIKDAGIKVE